MADTTPTTGAPAGNPEPTFTALARSPREVYRTQAAGYIVTGTHGAIELFRGDVEGINCSLKMRPAMARALARELLAAADAIEGAAA